MLQKFFRFILSVIVLFGFFSASAQSYSETALLFTRSQPGGSARIQALGGSQVALGGDYSSALSNPAGLGMFNRSEFTFSTGLSSHSTFTNYLGNKTDDNRSVFNIPGFSLVLHNPKDNRGFLGGSFAISFSRVNDFNRSILYSGRNDQNSIIDYFMDQAFGLTTYEFTEKDGIHYNTPIGLAYHNFLIGPLSSRNADAPDDVYFTDAGWPEKQQEEILVKGAANQWSFSYGGNIQDKFFFGGGVGIISSRYKSQKIFSETFTSDTLEYLQLDENLHLRGTGINATLGLLVRPVDFFQVGVSLVTPTYYTFAQDYSAAMSSQWNNFVYHYKDTFQVLNNENSWTDIVTSEYSLTTPLKLSTGVAFFTEYGFITGDVEFINPAKAKYISDTPGLSYTAENDEIRAIFKPSVNYRVGAEYRQGLWRFRAGYGVQGNTFDNSLNVDNKITTYSGGVGMRMESFYIDFALIHNRERVSYQPYAFWDGSGPVAYLKNRSTTGMLTLGFTF